MHIISPMPTGNGAYIVHKTLEKNIRGYEVVPYSPYLTLFPPALPFVSRRQADIIHTTPDYAWFFSRRGTPLVITFQNYVLDSAFREFSTLLQKIHYATDLKYFTIKAVEKAAVITAVSKSTAELARNDLGIEKEIEVIYNGVDTSRFRQHTRTKENSGRVKVLFSGNLTKRKGADLLVPICRLINKNVDIFYTQGLRTKLGLPNLDNLINLGSVSYRDMPDLYNKMDILIAPTVREGLSLSILEAMACGLPVITSNISSMPEQIKDGMGGILCEPRDPMAFANAINELSSNEILAQSMGQFNLERVRSKFNINETIYKYNDIFSHL